MHFLWKPYISLSIPTIIYMDHVDCICTLFYNLEQLSVDNPQLLLLFKKLKPKVWHSINKFVLQVCNA